MGRRQRLPAGTLMSSQGATSMPYEAEPLTLM